MKTSASRILPAMVLLVGFVALNNLSAAPVVSNIRAVQRPGTQLVDILYNFTAIGPCTITIAVSADGGANYSVPAFTFSGAVGTGVTPGNDRALVWNAGLDWPGRFTSNCRVRVTADDGTTPFAPGMAYIPPGGFSMGDTLDGSSAALPVHPVYVSSFFMDKYEVTGELFFSVFDWAATHGYSFNSGGLFKAGNHPVQSITWYDAVKWCNARSEKEGLTPCYYLEPAQTTVYRTGSVSITNACVQWSANGYRLPTEAEWEKAARGSLNARRFPWGDTIAHSQANYYSDTSYAYDISPTRGYHPTYTNNPTPYTSPVGSFAANGYGLFDMSGNVWEWVWDWYDSTYYGQVAATQDNPRGPTGVSSVRVLRGGSWVVSANAARCAYRYVYDPSYASYDVGFRCVRGL
jgi:sulfatase modifying factor 1